VAPPKEYAGSSIYLVPGNKAITGNEGNGVIEFIRNYSSITFTNPVFEHESGVRELARLHPGRGRARGSASAAT
jgi:hypothetical protein